eukprot:3773049-Pleurochrysis_carterae.AAC.1
MFVEVVVASMRPERAVITVPSQSETAVYWLNCDHGREPHKWSEVIRISGIAARSLLLVLWIIWLSIRRRSNKD